MFSGLFKWIAGFQVKTNYQAVLLAASYPDQYPPDEQSIQTILQAFNGKNDEVRPQVAVVEFFKLLDKGQYRSYWTFNLKMLVIMDRSLQQRLIVEDILTHDSKYLSEFHNFGQASNSTLRNKLISQYYSYIKSKAQIYNQPRSMFSIRPRDRLAQISKTSVDNTVQLIKTAHQLHRQILLINTNYKNGDKKSQLVEYVFCNLLNTVLTCYTLQSICTSVLITKIASLQFHQLMEVKGLVEQMNKTTKDTVRFIESNKELEGFKDMKYGQFFSFDARIVGIIDQAIKNFDQGRKSVVRDVQTQQWKQNSHPLQVSRASLQIKGFKRNNHFLPTQPRKLIRDNSQDLQKVSTYFKQFKNNFNDDVPDLILQPLSLKHSNSMKGKSVSFAKPPKFDQNTWDQFNNIYS